MSLAIPINKFISNHAKRYKRYENRSQKKRRRKKKRKNGKNQRHYTGQSDNVQSESAQVV